MAILLLISVTWLTTDVDLSVSQLGYPLVPDELYNHHQIRGMIRHWTVSEEEYSNPTAATAEDVARWTKAAEAAHPLWHEAILKDLWSYGNGVGQHVRAYLTWLAGRGETV